MAEFVEVPEEARRPKRDFPELPDFAIAREVQQWVAAGNPTFTWRGHTHGPPAKDEDVEFIGLFTMPKGIEMPCPCCTPNHTKFGKGVVGWFPATRVIRLMGEHCFRRLNPEAYAIAIERMAERQGRQSTITYLTANLRKKDEARRVAEIALPLAEHLDSLQMILGERLRRVVGIDLWQFVRNGGTLGLSTDTAQGPIITPYASVAGYRLVDPARKKLVPTLEGSIKAFDAIGLPQEVIHSDDTRREAASRHFSRGLRLLQETLYDLRDLREFVSIGTTATLRNWSNQPNALGTVYMRRDGLKLHIGRSEEEAHTIALRDVIDKPIPTAPQLVITG